MSDIRFNQWLHNSGTGGVSQVDGGHVGIGTTNPLIPVGAGVTAILNVGVVTANSYYGDGSNLSGIVGGGTSLSFNDNIGAYFGNSQDLKIYHDGNHSYIDDQGTGNLRLRSGTLEISNLAGNKTSATFSSGGGQSLNFNNSQRFVTTNTGAIVTGILTATASLNVKQSGNAYINLLSTGTGNAGIFMDASNGDIAGSDYCFIGQDNNLDLVIQANANAGHIDFKRASNTNVRINSSGELLVGTTNKINTSPIKFQVASNDATGSAIFARFNASVYSSYVDFYKSRSNTLGTATVVNSNDHLGTLRFYGADGSNSGYTTAAEIYGSCDGGSSGSGDMPGRITFHTRPDGAGQSMQERLRIDSNGYVTKPNHPMFIAGRTGGNQTFTVGTYPLNATRINVGNHYNTSTYKFTAPVAGVYYFYGQVYYNNGAGQYRIHFRKENVGGGALNLNTSSHKAPSSDSQNSMSIIESLDAGDTVRLFSDQNHSIQCYYNINDATYGAHTYFMGYLIG